MHILEYFGLSINQVDKIMGIFTPSPFVVTLTKLNTT